MHPAERFLIPAATALLLLQGALAWALPFDATSGIEARGRVDVDGFGPAAPLSIRSETEAIQPFTRSIVSVTDSHGGAFDYVAAADIGALALRVSASLTNGGTTDFFGSGVPIMQSVAELRDIVTLTTGRTDPFDVTLQLVVSGTLSAGPGSDISANSLITLGTPGQLSTTDSTRYTTLGTIQETLAVTKTVSGPSVILTIDALLSTTILRLAAGDTASGQLANSAFLSLILPPDVSIAASDSGTFGVPIPIPEPGTLVLSGLGALLLAVVRRRPVLNGR